MSKPDHDPVRGDNRLPPSFWEKVVPTLQSCWLWSGAVNAHGYGRVKHKQKAQYAYRLAYQALVGPVPPGLHLDHLCRRRDCVNPAHLEPVTPGENVRRGKAGENSRQLAGAKTCLAGHLRELYSFRTPNGTLCCRACRTEYMRHWRRRDQAA